jgi:hypothetical protein
VILPSAILHPAWERRNPEDAWNALFDSHGFG